MRLQKYLADAGIASRRKCEEFIKEGRVKINGVTAVIGAGVKENDSVLFDGVPVHVDSERVVIAFYKPKNVICSNSETEDRIKVIDYFKELPYRLYTVGRLDYDSEGLILVTNDGELANELTHPRYEVSKTYFALCRGFLTPEERNTLKEGVMLDDGLTSPAQVRIISEKSNGNTELLLTIHEGKNRQVRRMLAALGHETLKLRRVSIGKLNLSGLRPGQWRFLSGEEINGLLK